MDVKHIWVEQGQCKSYPCLPRGEIVMHMWAEPCSLQISSHVPPTTEAEFIPAAHQAVGLVVLTHMFNASPRTKNICGGASYSAEWVLERWLVLSLICLDFPCFYLLCYFIMPILLSARLLKMRVRFLCELSFKWGFKIKNKYNKYNKYNFYSQ